MEVSIQKHYTIKELTALGLGSRSTIDRLVNKGKLKRIKLGRLTRFCADDVQRYLDSLQAG